MLSPSDKTSAKAEEKSLVLEKSDSWKMFDDISSKYDFLNRLLSFGMDVRWRKKMASFIPSGRPVKLLDLATGTGDVLLSSMIQRKNIDHALGLDPAINMLEIAREKTAGHSFAEKVEYLHGSATELPFQEQSYDAITMAFGIRNVDQPLRALREMHRVLKPAGRLIIMEFSLPSNLLLRKLHLFYLRNIIPGLGRLISGHDLAYRYLNQTIEDFPYGEAFCKWMTEAGFSSVRVHPQLFGIVSIYVGEK